MSNKNSLYASISLDTKRRCLRFHKNIIHHFEGTRFLQFLVNPELMQFGVRFLDHECSGDQTYKVNPRRFVNANSYEIVCASFIDQLAELIGGLHHGCSYRFSGVVVPANSLAIFSLKSYDMRDGKEVTSYASEETV